MRSFRSAWLVSVFAVVGCSGADPDAVATAEQAAARSSIVWTQQFGSASTDFLASTCAFGGAVYAAGITAGELTTTAGGEDAFVRRYDTNGTIVWTRQFGDLEDDGAVGIAADASGVYVVGRIESGGVDAAFVRKFDHSGATLWSSQFGSGATDANAVAIDATGVYVVGTVEGAFPGETSAGGTDAFITKIELASGSTIWTRQFGSDSVDFASAVFADSTGVYVAGTTGGTLPGQTQIGGVDAFLRKYDLNGGAVPQFTKQFGTVTNEDFPAITGDGTGLYVATSSSSGPAASVLQRLDLAGGVRWTTSIANTSARAVAADGTSVFFLGASLGDVVLRRYDSRGKLGFAIQTGTTGFDLPGSLALDRSGIYLGGSTDGAFDGFTNAGSFDAFLMKIALTSGPAKSR